MTTLESTLREHFVIDPQSTHWMSRTTVLELVGLPGTRQMLIAVDRVLIGNFGLSKSIRNNQRGYQGIAPAIEIHPDFLDPTATVAHSQQIAITTGKTHWRLEIEVGLYSGGQGSIIIPEPMARARLRELAELLNHPDVRALIAEVPA